MRRDVSPKVMQLVRPCPEPRPLLLLSGKIREKFSSSRREKKIKDKKKKRKKRQSKHLGLCLGRQRPRPAQMEFILRSVIQSIRAQDVAGRVEPKNASLKQLNFMLCTQLSLGLAETSSFHGFCDSCCSNELLVQPRGRRRAALWPERGAGGARRGARLVVGSSTGLYGWCSVMARAVLSEASFLVLQEAGACPDTQHPPP